MLGPCGATSDDCAGMRVRTRAKATLGRYVAALRRSDLTLSPAGLNTECYRWLEAASQGTQRNTPTLAIAT